MYKENCFFFLEIFLVFNNHFHEFQLQAQLISSKENELLLSTKDIKKSFDNISPLPLFWFSNPTTQNISSNSKNWITQKVVAKRSKNRGMYNLKEKNRMHKRRSNLEHPVQRMDTDEILTFRRKVSPNCKLGHETFTVKKTSERDGVTKSITDRFIFYAVARTVAEFNEVPGFVPDILPHYLIPPRRKYQNQIAAIRCGPGWIYQLDVYADAQLRIGNGQGEYVESIVNARKCGIGVVLTELCLIDPDISILDEYNRGKSFLDNEGISLHQNCNKVVGLAMAAHPPGDGHVYLSSGIRIGYRKLLIHQDCLVGYDAAGLAVEATTYYAYDTQVAKDHYRSLSGEIAPCSGYGTCEAWKTRWFLCDET